MIGGLWYNLKYHSWYSNIHEYAFNTKFWHINRNRYLNFDGPFLLRIWNELVRFWQLPTIPLTASFLSSVMYFLRISFELILRWILNKLMLIQDLYKTIYMLIWKSKWNPNAIKLNTILVGIKSRKLFNRSHCSNLHLRQNHWNTIKTNHIIDHDRWAGCEVLYVNHYLGLLWSIKPYVETLLDRVKNCLFLGFWQICFFRTYNSNDST